METQEDQSPKKSKKKKKDKQKEEEVELEIEEESTSTKKKKKKRKKEKDSEWFDLFAPSDSFVCIKNKNKDELSTAIIFLLENEKIRVLDVFQLLTGEKMKARPIYLDRNLCMARAWLVAPKYI